MAPTIGLMAVPPARLVGGCAKSHGPCPRRPPQLLWSLTLLGSSLRPSHIDLKAHWVLAQVWSHTAEKVPDLLVAARTLGVAQAQARATGASLAVRVSLDPHLGEGAAEVLLQA